MLTLWKLVRPLVLLTALLVLTATIALADSKADMVVVMDKLAKGGASAESLIDWDNFVCQAPQLKNMDIHKMYVSADAANKKAFRTNFVKGFSSSFQKAAGGHTFAEAAKSKTETLKVTGKEPKPGMKVLMPKGGMQLSFVRKSGKLLLQKVVVSE